VKVVLVTQEDAFYIPRLIAALMPERSRDIVAISILPGEIGARNIRKYVEFMGAGDFTRHSLRYASCRVLDLLFPRGVAGRYWSVAAVAKHNRIPVLRTDDVNAPSHLTRLRELSPDLVVSIAAPQIFREELLALPSRGCINIHNALLPRYQGMLPSFWVLAQDEEFTGTTVHYMTDRVDAGRIILQEKLRITDSETVHSLLYRTKVDIGPRLLRQALSMIEAGEVPTMDVDWSQATYHSFPDKAAVARFRRLGKKFR
jgi:methionyl-tRNA formyltransferase